MCLLERGEHDAASLLLARCSLAGCPSSWVTQGLAQRGTILMHSSNKMLILSHTAQSLGVPAETTTDECPASPELGLHQKRQTGNMSR